MLKQIFILIIIPFFLISSCEKESKCENGYQNLAGRYMFYSDTSIYAVDIYEDSLGFGSSGLGGVKFWLPVAPFSGILNDDCTIIINEYKDVKRRGLSSPGGYERYYYESMSGSGMFFPDNDSIVLNLNYKRTENWAVNFSGIVYLKKIK